MAPDIFLHFLWIKFLHFLWNKEKEVVSMWAPNWHPQRQELFMIDLGLEGCGQVAAFSEMG